MISKTDKMIAEKDGPIGWITFNNPARRNAVSMEMWEALSDIVRDYANDVAIRVSTAQVSHASGRTVRNMPSPAASTKSASAAAISR